MIIRRKYHPSSWSKQAREFADLILEQGEYVWGSWAIANSYRPKLIRYRAAKRFGRALRKKNIV